MTTEELITKALKKEIPQWSFCYLYGSYATARRSELSDLDLIVVGDAGGAPFRKKFLCNGVLFDVFYFSPQQLNGYLHHTLDTGNFSLLYGICEASTLPAATPVSLKLLENARKVLKIGYSLGKYALREQRMGITALVDDLASSTNVDESIALVNLLYKNLIDTLTLTAGLGYPTGKHAARMLEKCNPASLHELNASFRLAANGDSSAFIRLTTRILNDLGGPLREGYAAKLATPPLVAV